MNPAIPDRRAVLAVALTIVAFGGVDIGYAWAAETTRAAVAPVDEANSLVGTASLDQPRLIGNAPPPGEPLYSGMTSPGASLPLSATEAAPVNINADLSFATGVPVSYGYGRPAMVGFTSGGSTYGARGEPIWKSSGPVRPKTLACPWKVVISRPGISNRSSKNGASSRSASFCDVAL